MDEKLLIDTNCRLYRVLYLVFFLFTLDIHVVYMESSRINCWLSTQDTFGLRESHSFFSGFILAGRLGLETQETRSDSQSWSQGRESWEESKRQEKTLYDNYILEQRSLLINIPLTYMSCLLLKLSDQAWGQQVFEAVLKNFQFTLLHPEFVLFQELK